MRILIFAILLTIPSISYSQIIINNYYGYDLKTLTKAGIVTDSLYSYIYETSSDPEGPPITYISRRNRDGVLDGVEIQIYTKSRVLIRSTNYWQGKKEGVACTYYWSGKIKSQITYQNNKQSGLTTCYDQNGSMLALIEINEGKSTRFVFCDSNFPKTDISNRKRISTTHMEDSW